MVKTKKLLSLLLIVVVCLGIFSTPVSAASKTQSLRVFSSEGYKYVDSTITMKASNNSGTRGTIKFNKSATFMGFDGTDLTIPAKTEYTYEVNSFKDGSKITLTLNKGSVSKEKYDELKYFYCVNLTGKIHTSGNSFSKLEKIDCFKVPLAIAQWNGVTQKVGFYLKK